MNREALIVIDAQTGFVNSKNEIIVNEIKRHLENKRYSLVVFTKFKNKKNSNFSKKLNWTRFMKSPESEIVDVLKEIVLKNHLIEKGTYSVFKSENLIRLLKKKKISKVYLCGFNMDACVLASAFDAFDLGFDFDIIKDLTYNPKKDTVGKYLDELIKKNFG